MTHLCERLRRGFKTRIMKRWGGAAAKKLLWDQEFANGQWDYLESTPDDPIYGCLEKYARQGSVLDLGCGSGNTGNELEWAKYGSYTGVDVSSVAVEKANARSRQNGREAKNEYVCADIENYAPRTVYDVILFRESIFYIPYSKVRQVLDRYANHLKPGGVFIVRMCDRDKYAGIVGVIQKHYRVIDQVLLSKSKDIVIIFRLEAGESGVAT
jgi:SAM-dependent methyltransferase